MILGHVQRGGTQAPLDRLLATEFGFPAFELNMKGRFGELVVHRGGRIGTISIREVAGKIRTVPPDHILLRAARAIRQPASATELRSSCGRKPTRPAARIGCDGRSPTVCCRWPVGRLPGAGMMGMDMPLGERLALCLDSAVGAAFSFLSKRSMLACAVGASALLLAGCFTPGRGVARESGLKSDGVPAERRDVQPFDAVRLIGCANLVVRVSQVSSVNVTADSGLRSRIATRVENGTLVIETVGEHFQSTCGVRIDISVPALRRLVLYGAGHAAVDGQDARENGPFRVEIDGSASTRWSGTATTLDAAVRGSGEIRLEGQAESLRASIDGSGIVDARALSVAEAGVEVCGTGQVRWGSATPQAKTQAGTKEPGSTP